MAKQTTEEELNLRRQARRRLIGAVALVLLAVFLLPVVFDSEPTATGNDIELRIPNKEGAGEFQPKIDLPELDKMAAEAAAASAAAAEEAAPMAAIPAPAQTPVKPAQEAVPKPEAKLVPAEQKPKTESKPAAAKPVAKEPAVPKTGWVVQVGAFSNADTAKNLRDKLSKQGYRAYTEKAGGVVRVRVGSFATQEAAEKVKARLEAQGMSSNLVHLG